MKFFSFLLVLSLCNSFVFAQTKWRDKEDSLYTIRSLKKISCPKSTESYIEFLKESGSLGAGLQVWFKEQAIIDDSLLQDLKIQKGKTLALFIPDNYKFLNHGEENIKVYLLNFSRKSLFIPRIDATLDSISEFIKINGSWLQLRKNHRSMCGNSYYKKKMASNEFNLFNLYSLNQESGTEILKYKLVFNYYGNKIESNEILVKLFANQVKRFLEEGMQVRY